MHHYLAVFPRQQDNLTAIMTSLKNSTEALSNSHFTVILFLLSRVLIFSWAIKKTLFLTTKTCTKFPIWYLPLITNLNIACFNSVMLLIYQASITCPVIQDQHYQFYANYSTLWSADAKPYVHTSVNTKNNGKHCNKVQVTHIKIWRCLQNHAFPML